MLLLREWHGRRGLLVFSLVLALLASTIVVGAIARFVPSSATNVWDASQAIRYDSDGTVIGTTIPSLIDRDDDYWINTSTPWPTNFFGTKYDDLCVTTNGSIYPSNGACTDDYDYGVGELAVSGGSPMIAALATDIDPGEGTLMIENEDGVMPSGPVTGTTFTSGSPNSLVVTTSASVADISVGDKVYFWGTGNSSLNDKNYAVTAVDTAAKTITLNVGTTTIPSGITQGKWYYYRTVTYGAYTGTSVSGSTVTLTGSSISEGAGLLVGDYVYLQSADTNVDAKIFEVTAVTSNTI